MIVLEPMYNFYMKKTGISMSKRINTPNLKSITLIIKKMTIKEKISQN